MDASVVTSCRSLVVLAAVWLTVLTGVSTDPIQVNVLWMATSKFVYYFNASTSLGALAYSVNTLNTSSGVSFNKFLYEDSNCNSKDAIGLAFKVYEEGSFVPDLILGPICSGAMEPVALLASYLNRPVFGWISSNQNLNDKTQFTTLVRTLWPISNLADGVIALCNQANWTRVYMIASDTSDEGTLGDAVHAAITSSTDIVVTTYTKDGVEPGISQDDIATIYAKVKLEARIIILSVPLAELRNWSLAAYTSNMYSGDYVFLYVNQQTADQQVYMQVTSTVLYTTADSNDNNVHTALRSFILSRAIALLAQPSLAALFKLPQSPIRRESSREFDKKDYQVFAKTTSYDQTNSMLQELKQVAYNTTLSSLIGVFAKTTSYDQTNSMLQELKQVAYNTTLSSLIGVPPAQPDFYSLFLIDALTIYTTFANATGTGNDGRAIFNAARSSVTAGSATGTIALDASCDRTPDYYFFKMDVDGPFDIIGTSSRQFTKGKMAINIQWIKRLIWANGKIGIENAPLSEPTCGFNNDKCDVNLAYVIPPVVIVTVAVIAGILGYCIRKMIHERNLANSAWKLNYDEIDFKATHGRAGGIFGSQVMRAVSTNGMNKSRVSVGDSMNGQMFITSGEYRGMPVAIKSLRKPRVNEDQKLREEMRIMLETKHGNLNSFIGACIAPSNLCVVWEYCSKGSLQDVIYNDAIQLDDMFKFSICIDMLKGLEHIHGSRLKVHGRLKSNNVVIDGRWVCKLTDYGLVTLTADQMPDSEASRDALFSKLYWSPPEELQSMDLEDEAAKLDELRCMAPSGDMFAVGIILKELFTRTAPFAEYEDLTAEDIVHRVRKTAAQESVFRPRLDELGTSMKAGSQVINKLSKLIRDLWSEDVNSRPNCRHALSVIIKINPSKNMNVMDNMMKMMEQYSHQLEETVEIRKKQLEEEKKKTELLLYRMLPRSIADKLKLGLEIEPESFDSVTIYFSDITGFQSLAVECSPFEVVDILNGVYGLFDGILPHHDVYKVETIGDVYVMVSGLPQRNGDLHVVAIANCALELISGALSFRVPHRPSHKLRMRIGIHTGPIVASVVGLAMPRYCLFGDTMNTASRMESHGMPLRIHLSPTAKEALSKFAGYQLADRGDITVKGKGVMNTYWLTGRVGYTDPLPDYSTEFRADDPRPSQMPTTCGKVVENKVLRPSIESGFNEADDAELLEDSVTAQSPVTHTFITDIAEVITPVG